jgi:hypothetical protein
VNERPASNVNPTMIGNYAHMIETTTRSVTISVRKSRRTDVWKGEVDEQQQQERSENRAVGGGKKTIFFLVRARASVVIDLLIQV